MPVDLTARGSLGIIQLNIDFVPTLPRNELVTEDRIKDQLDLERKYEHETLSTFLEYSNNWWAEYK